VFSRVITGEAPLYPSRLAEILFSLPFIASVNQSRLSKLHHTAPPIEPHAIAAELLIASHCYTASSGPGGHGSSFSFPFLLPLRISLNSGIGSFRTIAFQTSPLRNPSRSKRPRDASLRHASLKKFPAFRPVWNPAVSPPLGLPCSLRDDPRLGRFTLPAVPVRWRRGRCIYPGLLSRKDRPFLKLFLSRWRCLDPLCSGYAVLTKRVKT